MTDKRPKRVRPMRGLALPLAASAVGGCCAYPLPATAPDRFPEDPPITREELADWIGGLDCRRLELQLHVAEEVLLDLGTHRSNRVTAYCMRRALRAEHRARCR